MHVDGVNTMDAYTEASRRLGMDRVVFCSSAWEPSHSVFTVTATTLDTRYAA